MTYHGAVKVGGPPDVRELAHLIISKVAVGPYDNNAYLLRCRASDEQLLIDAAADAPVLLETVGDRLATAVTTHRHHDHWGALAEVVAATGARTAASTGSTPRRWTSRPTCCWTTATCCGWARSS